MSNYDTEKAITTNLSGIITTALGMKQEDASNGQGTAVQPLCVLLYKGASYTDIYNERPDYRHKEMSFSLLISFNEKNIATVRDRMQYWVTLIRQEVTREKLNVGDLAISKLVSRVAHDGVATEYTKPALASIDYQLTADYRET